jgi:hypothetical protein
MSIGSIGVFRSDHGWEVLFGGTRAGLFATRDAAINAALHHAATADGAEGEFEIEVQDSIDGPVERFYSSADVGALQLSSTPKVLPDDVSSATRTEI